MPDNHVAIGPSAGGAPVDAVNLPNAALMYVDAVTGDFNVGNAGTGTTANILGGSGNTKRLAASITYDANVTAATITGFSWTVAASGQYIFDMYLPLTITTTGGITINFALTTATLTSIEYLMEISTATNNTGMVSARGTTATSGTKVIDTKTAVYTYAKVTGSMVVNAGGTFAWQGCQNTSATGADVSIILLGAYARMIRVA